MRDIHNEKKWINDLEVGVGVEVEVEVEVEVGVEVSKSRNLLLQEVNQE